MPCAILDSPIGPLGLVASDVALRAVLFGGEHVRPEGRSKVLDETARQLDAYFAGDLVTFDLPLELHGQSSSAAAGWRSHRSRTARR